MSESGGFIKLHRSVFESDVAEDDFLMVVWIRLLGKANWKKSKSKFDGNQIELGPGEFKLNLSKWAADQKWSKTKVWRAIEYLKKTERITTKSGTRGLLITICNWSVYQGGKEQVETLAERQRNANETLAERQRNACGTRTLDNEEISEGYSPLRREEGKKGRREEGKNNKKNNAHDVCAKTEQQESPLRSDPDLQHNFDSDINSDMQTSMPIAETGAINTSAPKNEVHVLKPKLARPKTKSKAEPQDRSLAMKWASWTMSESPNGRRPDIDKWAESISKIKRVTKMNHEQMESIFEFAKVDDFWSDHIASPSGLLRVGKNDRRKVDNILASLKRKHFKFNSAMKHMEAIDRGEVQLGGGTVF